MLQGLKVESPLTSQSCFCRCIKPELKSLALGIHTLATRTLGENHLWYSVHYCLLNVNVRCTEISEEVTFSVLYVGVSRITGMIYMETNHYLKVIIRYF